MSPSHNPAAHCLDAKVWECLRRNERFKTACNHISPKKSSVAEIDAMLGRGVGYRYRYIHAFAVMNLLRGHTFWQQEVSIHLMFSKQAYLNLWWKDLPKVFREWFKQLIPYVISLPVKVVEDDAQIADLWHSHRLIAVPRVFGNRTKPQIFNAIKTLIEPDADRRMYKANGSFFGKGEEWKLYLAYEKWTVKGYSFDAACNLAAHEVGGNKPQNLSPEEAKDIVNPEGKNVTHKRHKRSKKVEKAVKAINQAIESMFP